MGWEWKLVEGQCIGCGICADVCADEAIKMGREMAFPESIADRCTGCMLCVQQCPTQAIKVRQPEPA